MSNIVEEIRHAYADVGIRLDVPAAYGTYYRLLCAGCGRMVGNVGDRLLPGMAAELVAEQFDLYASGLLGCSCGHQSARAAARRPAVAGRAATPGRLSEGMMADGPGVPSEMSVIEDAERRGRTGRWPLWRQAYAQGDPLPQLTCRVSRPTYRFDEGEPLPGEYKELLIKMLRHEGERAGNKSFLGFMATCLDIAEALFPTAEAKLLKAEYLAEELKHAIMFHRVAVGLQHDFALRDVPYAHYAFHLPRQTWADDAFFHFFVDLN